LLDIFVFISLHNTRNVYTPVTQRRAWF
jgi:hypothetical protein